MRGLTGKGRRRVTDISMSEILVVLVLTLLVFGPDQIPKVARTLGKAMAVLRRFTDEFRYTLEESIREEEFARMRKETERKAGAMGKIEIAPPPGGPPPETSAVPEAPAAPAAAPASDPADGR
jgi:sec-independent protein translocase protein TatB